MVEQLGFAIIFFLIKRREELTSGTINGTSLSRLQRLELSITIVPCRAKIGANLPETSAPALKIAMSDKLFLTACGVRRRTTTGRSLTYKTLPEERCPAKNSMLLTGKRRRMREATISRPTSPVAPIMLIL